MPIDDTSDTEPPQWRSPALSAAEPSLGDLMVAASPPPLDAHVTVYGYKTLPLLLTLTRHGCAEAASCQPTAPCSEAITIAWIANVTTEADVGAALSSACHAMHHDGRLVLDATAFRRGRTLSALLTLLHRFGLRIAALLPSRDHLIVVASRIVPKPQAA